MIFAALDEAAARGRLILVEGGVCRWHLRRDGVVVVREILVLPERRGAGIGRKLLDEVRRKNPGAAVVARCPAGRASNGFWRRMGFELAGEADGVNEWRLRS